MDKLLYSRGQTFKDRKELDFVILPTTFPEVLFHGFKENALLDKTI